MRDKYENINVLNLLNGVETFDLLLTLEQTDNYLVFI